MRGNFFQFAENQMKRCYGSIGRVGWLNSDNFGGHQARTFLPHILQIPDICSWIEKTMGFSEEPRYLVFPVELKMWNKGDPN